MTSGRKLTEQERDTILRLAGKETPEGEWLLSYKKIATQLDLSERTVRRWIRRAAVKFGERTGWKSDEFL
ncbi:MAG: sigma factor-like helix-turn-helix DNA-binding protein [Pirellulaceae bacterium]